MRSTTPMTGLSGFVLVALTALPAIGQVTFEDRKLVPKVAETSDMFGGAIAVSGSITVIGAYSEGTSGAVYVIDAISGHEHRIMRPDDLLNSGDFGRSVAVSGTTAIVGSPGDHGVGPGTGSAYIMDITTGQAIHTLTASNAVAFDQFGSAVDISGSRAVVGAPFQDTNGTQTGMAYIFDTATGQELHKLTPTDGEAGDRFGSGVAISGALATVGAYLDTDNGANSGTAYVFDAKAGQQLIKLLPSDGLFGDAFGFAVAIDGQLVVAGAPSADPSGSFSGAAYAYNIIGKVDCPADLNSDGFTDFLDISAFLNAYTNNQPAADMNDDGNWDFLDISAFLNSYGEGCP